ncbi:MAG: hypothetical protein A2497_07555 [Candidatus Firestonebacteria bacterium RifOxyC12_full_39_7]|nr:MAG: hypothetical protein A2497_07555 [Candidatus Firestonebacteria bacterium RifOxyC12_full_39_7]
MNFTEYLHLFLLFKKGRPLLIRQPLNYPFNCSLLLLYLALSKDVDICISFLSRKALLKLYEPYKLTFNTTSSL